MVVSFMSYYKLWRTYGGFLYRFLQEFLQVFVLHKALMDGELSGNYDLPFLSLAIYENGKAR